MAYSYLKGVVTLEFDREKCNCCGICLEVCPRQVFKLLGMYYLKIQKPDACIECGACAMNCPSEAISVQKGAGCARNIMWGEKNKEPCCGCTDCRY